jgi:hypothetical protein
MFVFADSEIEMPGLPILPQHNAIELLKGD